MGWFGDSNSAPAQASNDYNSYCDQPDHQAKISHEMLGGAGAFAAAKAWEDHQAANGKPVSHALAKEALAGIAGAFIDREVETRGLDEVDKIKAKRHAEDHINNIAPEDLGY